LKDFEIQSRRERAREGNLETVLQYT
jgi:hypothetical protein